MTNNVVNSILAFRWCDKKYHSIRVKKAVTMLDLDRFMYLAKKRDNAQAKTYFSDFLPNGLILMLNRALRSEVSKARYIFFCKLY